MIYIYKDRIIHIEWTILKGVSDVREDFTRAKVAMFLSGNGTRHAIGVLAEDGVLKADVPQGLSPGVYSMDAVWIKNEGAATTPPCRSRCICRARADSVFAVTEYVQEATSAGEGEVVVKAATSTATYGYDGLDAYQMAALKGYAGTEEEWLESLKGENGKVAIGDVSVSVSGTSGTPEGTGTATVRSDGTTYDFAFAFSGLKGDKGDAGNGNGGGSDDCITSIVQGTGSFTYAKMDGTEAAISTDAVLQEEKDDETLYPVALAGADAGSVTGSIAKTSKAAIQPSTGNLTCGTVNGVDVEALKASVDGFAGSTIRILPQSEYDALAEKDGNTIYFIKG